MQMPEMVAERKPRIWIQGSCVTRDALKWIESDIEIVRYRARSSIVSLVSPKLVIPEHDASPLGRFEYLNVVADFEKTWKDDFLKFDGFKVFDFIDERFGIVKSADGCFTYSTGLRAIADQALILGRGPYFGPSSTAYLDLVEAAISPLREILSRKANVFVLKTYWATRKGSGEAFDTKATETINRMNVVLDAIYAGLDGCVRFIEIDREGFVSADDHKWGAAPFHYIPETERLIAAALLEAARGVERAIASA